MAKTIYAMATLDTKAAELEFLATQLRSAIEETSSEAEINLRVVDVSTLNQEVSSADISPADILAGRTILSNDRGEAIATMSTSLEAWMTDQLLQHDIGGVIGIGGSGGTAMITAAMRALPIGVPKMMLSTMASGDTAAYVGCSDITMMYSVVDLAGLNVVSRRVLTNAANAFSGMVFGNTQGLEASPKATLGMTMFGVTTPCVTRVRERLEQLGFDCLVFHATGSGGRAMEKLVASGMIQGVLDITTTEVADQIAGGIMPAGDQRFDATIQAEIPFVLSLGALDMVNFGSMNSVPQQYRSRQLLAHNPQVTLMRTDADENLAVANWISRKLNRSTSPVTVCLPEGGVSSLDTPGSEFYSPEIRELLFSELQKSLSQNSHCKLSSHHENINADSFSDFLVDAFVQQWEAKHGSIPNRAS